MIVQHAAFHSASCNGRTNRCTCVKHYHGTNYRQASTSSVKHTSVCSRPPNLLYSEPITSETSDSVTVIESGSREAQTYRVAGRIVSVAPRQKGTTDAPNSLFTVFLPDGFPETVSPDYLPYQLWSIPAHITGWLSISLTTSSLLSAVGLNPTPVGATASAAAIKWITKDGIGAAGKVLVGVTRRLGLDFDDDPRRWRMIAEGVTTAGLALEVATSVFPQQFLLLASTGNFLKALGKGITLPVFRVIQTHQAVQGNVGPIAAKEELWEVVGQLSGYASSLAVLQLLEATGLQNWQSVVTVWVSIQALHIWLRYIALSNLCFDSVSHKRGCLLAMAHVAGRSLPGVVEANKLEPMLLGPQAVKPSILFGCSVQAAFGKAPNAAELMGVLDIYESEPYILTWRQRRAFVVLKDGSSKDVAPAVMQAMWQAAWLEQHAHAAIDSSSSILAVSLHHAKEALPSFLEDAQAAGWQMQNVVCNTGGYRVTVERGGDILDMPVES